MRGQCVSSLGYERSTCPQMLQLCAQIDLQESIKPRKMAGDSVLTRHVFIVDGRDFTAAVEQAVQDAQGEKKDDQALEHIINVANRNPEICVVTDGRGNLSAWGIE